MTTRKITIGRSSECNIRLEDQCTFASQVHAVIRVDASGITFEDCSSNGTNINGYDIHGETVVVHYGDVIRIANRYPLDWGQISQAIDSPEATVPDSPNGSRPAFKDRRLGDSASLLAGSSRPDDHRNLLIGSLVALIVAGLVVLVVCLFRSCSGTSDDPVVVTADHHGANLVVSRVGGGNTGRGGMHDPLPSRNSRYAADVDTVAAEYYDIDGITIEDGNPLTEDEASCVAQSVRVFFGALSDCDEAQLVSSIASHLTLLGKSNATKVDMIQFMKRLYTPDMLDIQFSLDEFKVQKGKDRDGNTLFNVSLNVDARFSREDLSKETYANYDCRMVLKNNYKIVMFNLKKLSSY